MENAQNNVDQANAQNAPGVEEQVNQTNDNASVNTMQTQANDSNGTQEKTFTQQQVNQMMANEKRQGKESVYRELGIDPKNEKQMAMFKAFIDSQNVDVDAEEQLAKSEAKYIEAEQKAMIAELKVEAMKLGVQSQYVDDVITLVSAKVGQSEETDIKSVLTELKSKYPVWFAENSTEENSTGQRGTGSPVGSSSGNSGSGESSIGTKLAAQRRASNSVKNNFWNK